MWLERIVFNIQTRLLGREQRADEESDASAAQSDTMNRPRVDRATIVQERLLDLDKRLEALQ